MPVCLLDPDEEPDGEINTPQGRAPDHHQDVDRVHELLRWLEEVGSHVELFNKEIEDANIGYDDL